MTHGHASQEGEHAAHHAQDPFDRRVAMSMVIIAAALAAVKVLGHRAHNETLIYQIKANVAHTQESDQWNFFQSKKMREVLAKQEANLLLQGAAEGKTDKKAGIDWAKRQAALVKEFEQVLNPEQGETSPPPPDSAARTIVERLQKRYQSLLSQGLAAERVARVVQAEETSERYRAESRYIQKKATDLQKAAEKYQEKSNHKHHQADRFDLGELFVELALVLSSVAILSKRTGYWYAGILLCAAGLVVVVTGFFVH